MSHDLLLKLTQALNVRRSENAFRSLRNAADLVDFSSNDYLGFGTQDILHKDIVEAISSLRHTGSGGSRLLTGNYSLIEHTEEFIAQFHKAPSALYFNSGYEANVGVISTLTQRGNVILYDKRIHASLHEGIKLSKADAFAFPHNDVAGLEKLLQDKTGEKWIVVESVYSMDGDLCPLQEIVELAKKYHAHILLDEAHATGVIGNRGEGLAQKLGLENDVIIRIHTFGKAIGSNGAVVLCTPLIRDYLINFCKNFIYTTAPNPLQVTSVLLVYKALAESDKYVQSLHRVLAYFMDRSSGYPELHFEATDSAIFSIIIPGNAEVSRAAKYLQNGGMDVRPIRYPTVARGAERLRICVHAFNTEMEMVRLFKLLDTIIKDIRN
ncbi:MAG: 8-amino-7-oxononanoate synthase [Chitinophagales bacterium]